MQKSIFSLLSIAIMVSAISVVACANSVPKRDTRMPKKEKPVCASWIHPDSLAYTILGRHLTEITFSPKKVQVYTVALSDSANADNMVVDRAYVADSLVGVLTKAQTAVLDYILLADRGNYVERTELPMMPHRPVIAFRFTSKAGNAIVWYSPDDFTWGIRYDDRSLFTYSIANYELMNRFCNSFLPTPIINRLQ